MATDRMYELAFQFKAAKLWRQLADDQVFAVMLSDGKVGYCNVMGKADEYFALALYVGDEGYQSLRLLLDADLESIDDIQMSMLMCSQSCVQCSFECKDFLSEESLEEIRKYARNHHKSLRGKNAFPQFIKYQFGRLPWSFQNAEDENRICDALSAAIALNDILNRCGREELNLRSLRENVQEIPILIFEDGHWVVRTAPLPSSEMCYPRPLLHNEVLAMRLKKKRKRGEWECGTLWLPTPLQDTDHEDEAPYYPLVLVCVTPETGFVNQPLMAQDNCAEDLLDQFTQLLMDCRELPQTIYCGDACCFALLTDLCAKIGIRLEETDDLEILDDVLLDMLEHFELGGYEDEDEESATTPEEDLEELVSALDLLSDAELRTAPQEIVNLLYSLAEAGELPDALTARVKRLFRRKKK